MAKTSTRSIDDEISGLLGELDSPSSSTSANSAKPADDSDEEISGLLKQLDTGKQKKPKQKQGLDQIGAQADQFLNNDQGMLGQAYKVGKQVVGDITGAPGEFGKNTGAALMAIPGGLAGGAADVFDATVNLGQAAVGALLSPGGQKRVPDYQAQYPGAQVLPLPPKGMVSRVQPTVKQSYDLLTGGAAPHTTGAASLAGMMLSQPGLKMATAPGKAVEAMLPNRLGRALGGYATGTTFGTAAGVNEQMRQGQPINVPQAVGQSQGLGLIGGTVGAVLGAPKRPGDVKPQIQRPTFQSEDPQTILRQYYKDPSSVREGDVAWAQREFDRMHREQVQQISNPPRNKPGLVEGPPDNIFIKRPDADIRVTRGTGKQLPVLDRNRTQVRAPERNTAPAPYDDIVDVEYTPNPPPKEIKSLRGPTDDGPRRIEQRIIPESPRSRAARADERQAPYTPVKPRETTVEITPESRRLSDRKGVITPPSPRMRVEEFERNTDYGDASKRHPDAKGEAQASPEYFIDKIRKADDPKILDQIIRDKDAPPEFIQAAMDRWEQLAEKPKSPSMNEKPGSVNKEPENLNTSPESVKEPKQLTIDEWADRYNKEDEQYPLSKKRFPGSPNTVFERKGKQVYTAKTESSWTPRDMSDVELEKASDWYEVEQKRKGMTSTQRRRLNEEQKGITEEKMRREMRRAEGLPQDFEPKTYREEQPLETQNPRQAEGEMLSDMSEGAPERVAGDQPVALDAQKNILGDRIRQLHEEYSTSDQIAKVLKRENPELVKGFGTIKELADHVREHRAPEITKYLDSIKNYRNPDIKRIEPPEGTKEAPSSLGHLSDGYEYFVKKAANGDRQVWRAKTGEAGANAEHAGSFKEIRNAHPELFDKSRGQEQAVADSIAEHIDKRGRRAVNEFLKGESGEGPALGWLDEAAALKMAQWTAGKAHQIKEVIEGVKDPETRAKYWDAAQKIVGQVSYDVDKMHAFDRHGLYRDFLDFQGEADSLLRGVEIPKSAQIKTLLSKAGKLSPKEIWDMEGLTDSQKEFAVKTKMLTEDFQEIVKDRYDELSTELEKDDPYLRFLEDYYEHISGKDIKTGQVTRANSTAGNAIKDYWYDAIVTGNWHIHSLHLFDALIHGTGYLGRDFYSGAKDALFNPTIREFVKSHQGSGLMKASRFNDEASLKDAVDSWFEKKIESVPGGKTALKWGRKIEGSGAESLKIEVLRAGVLNKIAKQMKYEGGAEKLARDIMDNKIDAVTKSEVYTRMASDLFDMIGYQAMGVKNRNVWQRGALDLPGGGEVGFKGASVVTKMLQPFMGMRTVQSRLLWKMWGDVVKSSNKAEFIENLKPVLRLHTMLMVNGGAATLPRAAQAAIYYALGAPTLNAINKQLEQWNLARWTIGHMTPDAIPPLFATWDGLTNIMDDARKNAHEFAQGDLGQKISITAGMFGGSVAGLPSVRNVMGVAKNFGAANEGKKETGVYEETILGRNNRRGTIKEVNYDSFKALFDSFMPRLSRKELHAEAEHHLNKSRFLDWVKAKYEHKHPGARKMVAKALKGKKVTDWWALERSVNERFGDGD